MIKAIQKFKELVVPEKTRIEFLSPLILVFGGLAVKSEDRYSSCRNVFLNWAAETNFKLARYLRTPEQFPEWNHFEEKYNLVDFEIDVGCLSSGILLFLESPGALAELGAFCTDNALCERLLVVLEQKHYDADSFVKWGPVQRIEDAFSEEAICVVGTTGKPREFEAEVAGVGKALQDKVKPLSETKQFDAKEKRDQFLLIADLIELFGALTEIELKILLGFMGVEPLHLKRMLKQLALFELIFKVAVNNERYYVPPKKQRMYYLKYTAPTESKFERVTFKLLSSDPVLKKDSNRKVAYMKIHGESLWK
ncbi:MAG: retron St85 family effector protein [Gallionella sp.]